ncbi:MAG: IS66 family insertion sequence element accessory protein TnpA [Lachnospiraceae bacterium]
MNQVTQVKAEVRKAHWKQLIQECQSSGMTVRDWCSQNGIKEQTYYRNLQKLRQEICDSLPVPVIEPQKPVAFKKLEVQAPLPNTQAAVIIRLPQATLEITEGTSQQTIQAVLLALQSIC